MSSARGSVRLAVGLIGVVVDRGRAGCGAALRRPLAARRGASCASWAGGSRPAGGSSALAAAASRRRSPPQASADLPLAWLLA